MSPKSKFGANPLREPLKDNAKGHLLQFQFELWSSDRMTAETTKAITESITRFEIIKPMLLQIMKADEIINAEALTANDAPCITALLDRNAGIDAYAVKNGQTYGIASRICNGSYKTFTVRKSRHTTGSITEFEKKKTARAGALLPYYTVQAYFDGDNFKYLALCYTSDLLEYIEQFEHDPHRVETRTTTDSTGKVEFYIVNWRNYAKWYGEKGFRTYPQIYFD